MLLYSRKIIIVCAKISSETGESENTRITTDWNKRDTDENKMSRNFERFGRFFLIYRFGRIDFVEYGPLQVNYCNVSGHSIMRTTPISYFILHERCRYVTTHNMSDRKFVRVSVRHSNILSWNGSSTKRNTTWFLAAFSESYRRNIKHRAG